MTPLVVNGLSELSASLAKECQQANADPERHARVVGPATYYPDLSNEVPVPFSVPDEASQLQKAMASLWL